MTSVAAPGSSESVTLAIAGDVMLGRLVNDVLPERGWAYPWGDLAELLWQADAFLINLECAISRGVVRWHNGHYKPFYFRADPGTVATLRAGRVDLACLANNHIGDAGRDGLLDTIAALDAAGVARAGAGRNLEDARRPAVLHVKGLRVGVVAFADYPEAWAASDGPGLNFTAVALDTATFEPVAAVIEAARAVADVVIFSMHWGPNMRERPPEEFRHFAHRVIDTGATVFWGHSAHLVQGIEFRGAGVILYDTGDFVDDYAVDERLRNDLGGLFLLHVRRGVVDGLFLIPVHIAHMQVNRARGQDHDWFLARLEALCHELGSTVAVDRDGTAHIAANPHVIPVPSGES